MAQAVAEEKQEEKAVVGDLNFKEIEYKVVNTTKWGKVENGTLQYTYTCNIPSEIKTIIIPSDNKLAKITNQNKKNNNDNSKDNDNNDNEMTIIVTKELSFCGHPPKAMKIKHWKKYLGLCYQIKSDKNNSQIIFATFGEFDTHRDGAATVSIEFIINDNINKNVKIERKDNLIGVHSIADKGVKDDKNGASYWYGCMRPNEKWTAV